MRGWARWVCFGAVLSAWCGPALAWTGEVGWPTFYRDGPDRRHTVLEELTRGMLVDVLSCDGGWCRVQNGNTLGYVEQSALVQVAAMPAKPPIAPPDAACFDSQQAGYKNGELYRFCPRPAR